VCCNYFGQRQFFPAWPKHSSMPRLRPHYYQLFQRLQLPRGVLDVSCTCISCGPTLFNEQLRNLASDAAHARAGIPKLVSPEQIGTFITDFSTTDRLVPQGYNFQASALSEGLTALFSRLVRPIWHKPAVVVTEGHEVKLHYLNETLPTCKGRDSSR